MRTNEWLKITGTIKVPENPELQIRGEFVVNAPMVSIENNTHDADGNPVVNDSPSSDPEE